jgi:hypothetical protein
MVLALPWTIDMEEAVVIHCPEIPIHLFNNASNIHVNEDETEDLVNRVINFFSSKGFPFACFRISPITYPRSFTSLLEKHGFERKPEYDESIMVLQKELLKDRLNPSIDIKEVSEDEVDLFTSLLLAIFEMSTEWKKAVNNMILGLMRNGAKHYLACVDEKPVGVTTLFSSQKTGGIFNVGTVKENRRRGIGTSLTAHAFLDSVDKGNDLHTLQAEKGGYAERLYQGIGFEIDHTVSYFVKNLATD